MNEIQLAQLRDIAIEYLPAAQQARDNFKQWCRVRNLRPADYAGDLVATAIKIRCDVTLPAVERAAANLLEAVAMWQFYDPNDHELADIDPTEHRAYSMRTIAEAVEMLATITGRDMAHLMPADAPAGKVDAVNRGLTKDEVITAFMGLHFDENQWRKALGKNIPDWLMTCRMTPGKQGSKESATWNPVLIAVALIEKGIAPKKLDAVFVGLSVWADAWKEASALLRD